MSQLVIRAPNHLGDLVMALPALHAAKPSAVVVASWLGPLVELAGFSAIHLEPGTRGFMKVVAELRRRGFSRGVLLTPSFSSALLFRLGGVRLRRGTDTDGRRFLLTSIIDKSLLEGQHRSSAYFAIATGDLPGERPRPWLDVHSFMKTGNVNQVRRRIAICPGSNAPSRSWPADRFAEVARRLSETSDVLVFGAPSERAITSTVAGQWATDMGGQTDLPALASALATCDLVISNDSGPLHLAAAVGATTVSIWGAGNPAQTGPPEGHTILRHTSLPCLECVKNQCPRSGRGYILPDAHNECLHLIGVDDVLDAVQATFADKA